MGVIHISIIVLSWVLWFDIWGLYFCWFTRNLVCDLTFNSDQILIIPKKTKISLLSLKTITITL